MRFVFALSIVLVAFLAAPSVAATDFVATIDGAQSGTPSTGTGSGTFVLRDDDVFEYEIVFDGLVAPESVAHVHGPALPGVNAGVVFGLPLGSPKIGNFGPLTAQQKADLLAGLWYVNIHSTLYTAGEIRGQIIESEVVSSESQSWGAIKQLFERD